LSWSLVTTGYIRYIPRERGLPSAKVELIHTVQHSRLPEIVWNAAGTFMYLFIYFILFFPLRLAWFKPLGIIPWPPCRSASAPIMAFGLGKMWGTSPPSVPGRPEPGKKIGGRSF
jgi:hypothetical protein